MKHVPLLFPFLLALTALLFASIFFQDIRWIAFGPFLAITFIRQNLLSSLWIAALCGLVVDLFNQTRFGITALNYTLITLFLYREKRHFFEEKALALAFYTAVICFLSSILQFLLLYVFGNKISFNLKAALQEFIFMPFADAAFAILWFTCPMQMYQYIKKTSLRRVLRRR